MMKTNATPGDRLKLAIIPVLCLVLAAVLFWPDGQQGNTVSAVDSAGGALPSLPQTSLHQPLPEAMHRPWPTAQLDDVVALDIFQTLRSQRPVVTSEAKINATDPDPLNVTDDLDPVPAPRIAVGNLQAVYQDAQGMVAILDSRIVRVGDVLPDGTRVAAITSKEIFVQAD